MMKRVFWFIPLWALCILLLTPVFAQNTEQIITLGVDQWMQDVFNETFIAEFEAQNPGVKVVVKALSQDNETAFWGVNTEDLTDTFKRASAYAAQADVLPLNSYQLGPEITRAGYFLDLTPLLNADLDFDVADFFPAALQSYQLDNGTWGLPLTMDLQVVIYNQTAFDAAGLAYPDESWGLEDFLMAGEALTVRDETGKVTLPALYGFDDRLLYRALLGQGAYDATTFPETPALNTPELARLITALAEYRKTILGEGEDMSPNFEWDKIPLNITGLWRLQNSFAPDQDDSQVWQAALLPGGVSIATTNGYAISSGTQYPEAAYALLKFITGDVRVTNRYFSDAPARRSLVGVEPPESEGGVVFFGPERSPEVQAVIDMAIEVALPATELRYLNYAYYAQQQVEQNNLTMEQALAETESKIQENLQLAEEQRTTAVVAVPTPIPTPILAQGEIALQFGLQTYYAVSSTQERWQAIADEFVANDPEVGQIVLRSENMTSQQMTEKLDCMVLPYNPIAFDDVQNYLPLDPLLNSDPNFNRDDLVPGVLAAVEKEGMTYGLPLAAQTLVIFYNQQLLEEAGAGIPYNGWTVSEFIDTLQVLKDANSSAKPFMPNYGNRYLLMLMAAYGGSPVDYSTTPPTYNLTDPAVQEAIRQVLDLAKDGLIDYQELATGSFGGGFGGMIALSEGILNRDDWRFQNVNENGEVIERPVMYPQGTAGTPISVDVIAGYISANTQYPEACYRWLSTIATTPELLPAMPARLSMLEDPALTAAHGETMVTLYTEFATLMQSPEAILFSGFGGATGYEGYITEVFMGRAFDNYVLKDADLAAELERANASIAEFNECAAGIPKEENLGSLGQEELIAYFEQFQDCAITADPEIESAFPDFQ